MSSFEKEYYEADRFWEGESLSDAGNLLRIQRTTAFIPEDVKSLADIGCGNGIFLNYLHDKNPGLQLTGVDRSETALRFVKTSNLPGDIAAIPLSDHSVDCVSCLEVIEHLPVTVFDQALRELARVSKQYIIVSTPYSEVLEENHTQCPRCKSIFNADLHLRNFSVAEIENLLEPYGYHCVKHELLGERINYKGHYLFRKIFYPKQFRQWRSPICPICGYREAQAPLPTHPVVTESPVMAMNGVHRRSLLSYVSWLPKTVWPKEKKYYWILALYKKAL